MDFPTFDDLFRVARDEILSRNAKLTKAIVEREGSDANAFTAAMAAVGDNVVGALARLEAALTLGAARGKDLDRLVYDRYNLLRKKAAPAVGSVEFRTTAPNPAPFNIPLGTKLQTSTGLQYVTTASASFPILSVGPIVVAVRCTTAGLDSQAAAGTITSIISTIAGQPVDLVVNNPLATAGGADAEEDDDLKARARLFFTTARRGTLKAIQAAALAVEGVVKANAFEVLDELGRPAKAVQLVVADQFTELFADASLVPPAYQAQSQVLSTAVYLGLDDARAAGIFVDVRVAKVILQGVVLALSFQAGVDTDAVAHKARARVVAYVNGLVPGAVLDPADVLEVLRGVAGLVVTGGEILSPLGPVQPTQLEVLRATMGLVVATTVQPDRTLAGSANPDAVG